MNNVYDLHCRFCDYKYRIDVFGRKENKKIRATCDNCGATVIIDNNVETIIKSGFCNTKVFFEKMAALYRKNYEKGENK